MGLRLMRNYKAKKIDNQEVLNGNVYIPKCDTNSDWIRFKEELATDLTQGKNPSILKDWQELING